MGKGGRKRGRETSMCGCLSCAPYWGPSRQPRHVPSLGIEPATFYFSVWHLVHWAMPARMRYFTFLRFYLFVFREKGRKGERGRETSMYGRNIDLLPLARVPTRGLAHNPGMCPDRGSNQWPFALRDGAQPTEPCQSGLRSFCIVSLWHTVCVTAHTNSDEPHFKLAIPTMYIVATCWTAQL